VKLTTRCLQFQKRHNLLVKNISTVVAKVVIDIEEDYVQRFQFKCAVIGLHIPRAYMPYCKSGTKLFDHLLKNGPFHLQRKAQVVQVHRHILLQWPSLLPIQVDLVMNIKCQPLQESLASRPHVIFSAIMSTEPPRESVSFRFGCTEQTLLSSTIPSPAYETQYCAKMSLYLHLLFFDLRVLGKPHWIIEEFSKGQMGFTLLFPEYPRSATSVVTYFSFRETTFDHRRVFQRSSGFHLTFPWISTII